MLIVAVAALSPLGTAASAVSPIDPRPFVSGVQTVPTYDYAKAIYERVSVETPTDGDADGKPDQVVVDIIRPKEADQDGVDVPVIVQASPYYEVAAVPGEYDDEGIRRLFPTWLDNYFVPRGYAVAFVDLVGTHRSSGCDDVGGDWEVAGARAVVDWFNGRADGFDEGGDLTSADWSTGKVGMIGVSWNGTIANGVASTGVEGLETIVPIASISSWYDYTRSFGLPYYRDYMRFLHEFVSNFDSAHCHDVTKDIDRSSEDKTGDYSSWWNPRNYRRSADQVQASVYVVHGLNDENVKTRHFGTWWSDLGDAGVERRIFLHQGVHLDAFSFRDEWVPELARWFDYYLQDLPNAVPGGPMVKIEREDGSFTTEDEWPLPGTTLTKMRLSEPLADGAGSLSLSVGTAVGDAESIVGSKDHTVTWEQGRKRSSDNIVLNPTVDKDNRAVFLSDELSSDLRLSGTSRVSMRVKVDQPAAGFQARVVDYGVATRYQDVRPTSGVTCWGQGDARDTGCYQNTVVTTSETDLNIVSRTKADVGHYESPRHKETLVPGQWYRLKYHLNTDDAIFAKGHQLGLVLTAEWDNPNTPPYTPVTMSVDTRHSFLTMPLSGDTAALSTAGTHVPVPGDRISQPLPPQTRREMIEEFVRTSR